MRHLYRVANHANQNGLWYNQSGEFINDIQKFELLNKDLPMDFDPSIVGWLSATDNLPELDRWFPVEDRELLSLAGYGTYEYEVSDFRQVDGHVVFQKSAVIQVRRIS